MEDELGRRHMHPSPQYFEISSNVIRREAKYELSLKNGLKVNLPLACRPFPIFNDMHNIQFKFQKLLNFFESWRTFIPHTPFICPPSCPISNYATGGVDGRGY